MAISDEFCNNSALGFHDNPKSINCTGNIGNPNVQIFLNTKRNKTKVLILLEHQPEAERLI